MARQKRVITRRDFIRSGSCVAVGSIMGFPLIAEGARRPETRSRVVLIRDKTVADTGGFLKGMILEKMLDEAVTTLFNERNPVAAWRQLVHPDDIVGIKSNVWGPLPTPEPLEKAIQKRLVDAGVKAKNISVDDRGVRKNPVFNKATGLINVRPMRTHHWSGLGTLLKNYIMFVRQPWAYHGNACVRLGAIWKKPTIQGKTRLNILVMLTPLFHGIGPHHFSRQYIWPYCGLIVSTDPVAADAIGARIIQAKRNEYFGQYRPISPPPRHIEAAETRYGLGNSHPDRIDLIKRGWPGDILV
ncbi:MAG: DUF362 domain-containing protein [Deltaproteobacteria bacterium]|nr:DUF362 domain-containing protein [Deltaproteobacteria bacterium]